MAASRFITGQRWISEAEPELGLGTILSSADGRVVARFPACGEQRMYAIDSAPLRRVRFRVGDRITRDDGTTVEVAAVEEVAGLLTYRGADGEAIPESRLSDTSGAHSPGDRLLAGQVDTSRVFDLRCEALELQHRRRKSPVRGFIGGRMDLIPHQLYIAREVTDRIAPRVLLADEVGLGKTIEACLIIHRLLGTGRASRVLVVVPEPLVHQWFVELLRRFNLWFHIYDEERCDAIEGSEAGVNPFHDEQWVLCALPLLLDPRRRTQATEAGWDLLVVDEAHHLRWSATTPSPEYLAIEALSRIAGGLLLLTATPEQLGLAGHFARLRLLDPDRYHDLAAFEAEARRFGEVAKLANKLIGKTKLGPADLTRLHGVLGSEPEAVRTRLVTLASGDDTARGELIGGLLDRHGPGRVIFRNTRAAMKGFPKRIPKPQPLDPPAGPETVALLDGLAAEFAEDITPGKSTVPFQFAQDPRLLWLIGFLRAAKGAKVLLICRRKEKVLALDAALRTHLALSIALFHEDLELVQRDRNAAWFADPEGAQILLASEIGSEGRNFQFAHHLVLFDLPLDPELLEQRIGRLDRIGQTANIQIHVPYLRNSPQEVLFRWYHEGLDALGRSLHAGRELLEQFGSEVNDLALDFHETHDSRRPELDALVVRTREAREELELRLEKGRDRLLELNSYRPGPAREIVDAIATLDADTRLEEFLLRTWDHFGVPVEDLGPRRFRLGADGVFSDSFPGLPPEGLCATLDRRAALSRDDVGFLTWDHPMVTGSLDLLLGGKGGSTAAAVWSDAPRSGLWLELVYVLECVAPPRLHADRFLPATPIRLILDARGQDVTAAAATVLAAVELEDVAVHDLLEVPAVRLVLTRLVDTGETMAEARSKPLVASALSDLDTRLGRELERLKALAAVNPGVRPQEIADLAAQRDQLRQHISQARLRLDAVRAIVLQG